MPYVLLTRPLDESEALAATLIRHGYRPVIEPLLRIEAVTTPPPDWENLQAVLATSARVFEKLPPEAAKRLRSLPCYCVGSRTLQAARNCGFENVHNADGDGLALAKLVLAKVQPGHGAVLHLAGRDTDGRMAKALQQAGFEIRLWILYAAEAVTGLSPTTIELFRQRRLDAVLVFSARTAEVFAKLLNRHGLEDHMANVIGLGISPAVCAQLQRLRWRRLEASLHPTEEGILQRLHELLPINEVP